MRLLDIMTSPWAIIPAKLNEIRGIYATHMKGEKIDLKALQSETSYLSDEPYQVVDGVAIISVNDVLTKNRTLFSFLFGGSSMRDIGEAFSAALNDPAVHSIVLAIDSPGGTVDGTYDLASQIYAARGIKPIVTVADCMASAAMWIGSAADRVFITGPTVEVGSIGVVAQHVDYSEQDRMVGEKYTEITAGKFKRIASIHKPLSDEGRAYIQDQVDSIYTVFVQSVAEYRGRSVEQVLEAADGKIFMGQTSVDVGLADGIATLAEVIHKLKEENLMNLDELKSKHPDIFQAAYDEGKASGIVEGVETGKQAGYDAGKAEGAIEGAKAEQERIKAVRSAGLPGHEALIESMIADGKTTGAEAMAAVIAAEKKVRDGELAKLIADGVKPAAAPAAPSGDAGVDLNLPVEERAKAEWDKKPEIRAEFGSVESYIAYQKASEAGRVKILGRK